MESETYIDNFYKNMKKCFNCCCWRTNDNHYNYMSLGVDEDDFTVEELKNNELRQHMNKNAHMINGEKVTFHEDE